MCHWCGWYAVVFCPPRAVTKVENSPRYLFMTDLQSPVVDWVLCRYLSDRVEIEAFVEIDEGASRDIPPSRSLGWITGLRQKTGVRGRFDRPWYCRCRCPHSPAG